MLALAGCNSSSPQQLGRPCPANETTPLAHWVQCVGCQRRSLPSSTATAPLHTRAWSSGFRQWRTAAGPRRSGLRTPRCAIHVPSQVVILCESLWVCVSAIRRGYTDCKHKQASKQAKCFALRATGTGNSPDAVIEHSRTRLFAHRALRLQAHSRLATLLSELRLHDAAARALEAALKAPALSASERRDYEARLRDARAEAQKRAGPRLMGSGGGPRQPDHYKLLSLQRSCTVDEVGTLALEAVRRAISWPKARRFFLCLVTWCIGHQQGLVVQHMGRKPRLLAAAPKLARAM